MHYIVIQVIRLLEVEKNGNNLILQYPQSRALSIWFGTWFCRCNFFQKCKKNYNWWSDFVLRKMWLDLILQLFAKNIYVVKNTSSELTWFCTLTFYYINIFCKKLKYKIKPNFSKDIIRPPLAIFSAFLKKNYKDKIKSFSKSKWTGL